MFSVMVDVVLELGWLWLCVLMRESFYLPQQPAMMGTTTSSFRVFNPVSFSIALLLPFYFFDVSFD